MICMLISEKRFKNRLAVSYVLVLFYPTMNVTPLPLALSKKTDAITFTFTFQKRKKDEELAAKQRAAKEEADKQLAELKRLEDRERRKDEIRMKLPAEPDGDNNDVVKILLKLPNGTRLERRFLKTQSLKVSGRTLGLHLTSSVI